MGVIDRALNAFARRVAAAQDRQFKALRRELDDLRATTSALSSQIKLLTGSRKQLERVLANQKNDDKFRQIFRRQLAALIRARYLPSDIPDPLALQARRFRLRSQNEEDGIILALLEATGVGSRRFVEIGSGGTGGNSAVLAHDMGWSGLMVDASRGAFRVATHEYRARPVTIVQAMVTPDNVNTLLQTHGFTGEIDLLSIDVDSIDYWIFDALRAATARVVVLEYNAHFGATRAVTIPNGATRATEVPEYWGASLAALHKAASRKGYRLVLCEEAGVNAFFVREDLATEIPGMTPEQAYRPFRHRLRDDQQPNSPEQVFAAIAAAGLTLVEV